MLHMTVHASIASLVRVMPTVGRVSAAGSSIGEKLSTWVPQLGPAIVLGLLVALMVSCLVVLLTVRSILRRRAILALGRDAARAAGTRTAQPGAASSLLTTAPVRDMSLAGEGTRLAVGGPPSDYGFQALVEDVPGVGRIEWDAQTVRAFACQPDVLQRLAFHRWRMQQGMLSEFELATRKQIRPVAGEHEDSLLRGIQAPQRVAPNSQGLQARAPGQQTNSAEQ
jgi:hypothetical protein